MTKRQICAIAAFVLLSIPPAASLHAQARIDKNVIYGMFSGLALLMDVHYPRDPNGYGIIVISGSGWHLPLDLDGPALKERVSRQFPYDRLLSAGYTLFALNHRTAPRFRYPSAVEDAQRAVRFIRYNADTYEIDPSAIGAMGGSSGGHLVNMLGVLEGQSISDDTSPINRESAKVQAVVAYAAPSDFVAFAQGLEGARGYVSSFLGVPYPLNVGTDVREAPLYREASPITHVSPDDPSFLLVHGDADRVVPFQQSELFRDALASERVEVALIRVAGAGHGPDLFEGENGTDIFDRMIDWFDRYLRGER